MYSSGSSIPCIYLNDICSVEEAKTNHLFKTDQGLAEYPNTHRVYKYHYYLL